jgi:hypothetical protein
MTFNDNNAQDDRTSSKVTSQILPTRRNEISRAILFILKRMSFRELSEATNFRNLFHLVVKCACKLTHYLNFTLNFRNQGVVVKKYIDCLYNFYSLPFQSTIIILKKYEAYMITCLPVCLC